MEEQSKQITFHDLLEIVSRRRWFVGISIVLFGVVGTIIGLAKPDIYSVKSVFLVKDPAYVSELYGTSLVSVPFTRRLTTIEEDVRAYGNIRGVVDDMALANGDRSPEEVTRRISDGLRIEVLTSTRGDTTVVLQYKDTSPSVAAGVANSLRERYINGMVSGYLEQVKHIVDQNRESVERIEEAQADQLERIREFDERHLLDVASKISETSTKARKVDEELSRNEARIALRKQQITGLESDLDKMSQVSEKIEQEDNPRWAALADKVLKARKKVSELEDLYTDEYQPLAQAREELALAESKLNEEKRYLLRDVKHTANENYERTQEKIRSARREVAALQERQKALRAEKETLDRSRRELPRLKSQYAQLELGLERGRESLQQAVAQLRRAENNWENARESAQLYFETVDQARVPRTPSGPNRILWVLGGAAAGLAFSLALSVVLHLLSRSLTSVSEAKTFLDVPIMGTVETIRSDLEIERGRRRRAMAVVFAMLLLFTGSAFLLLYTQFPELLPGFVRDSITAFRERIR